MYRMLSVLAITVAMTLWFQGGPAKGQAIPKSLQQAGDDAAIKQRRNAWIVGVAGGLIDGTYMRFADELAKVLDDGDNLRRSADGVVWAASISTTLFICAASMSPSRNQMC